MVPKNTAVGPMGRYVFHHIFRTQGKSLLCVLLAVIFMLGLMLIRVSSVRSENELEHLYTTTIVTAEIVKATSNPVYGAGGILESGFVIPRTVERLTDTGFLSHCYVESSKKAVSLVRVNAQGTPVDDETYSFYHECDLYGIEYPKEFFDLRGTNDEIFYLDDWDESMFRQSWLDLQKRSEGTQLFYPAIISQELYDRLQLEEGDLLRVAVKIVDPDDYKQNTTVTTDLTVVGLHQSDMTTLIFPVATFRGLNGVNLNYNRVILTIDPAKNRQIDELRTMVNNIIAQGGLTPLRAIYSDQELRQAIAPMEQVISFMKALYPVTLGLSFIVAAGIAVLLSLLSAKEAAILRVLGNSKTTCRVILCLQTILPCIVGVVIGHLGAVAMAYLMLPAEDAAGLMLPALGRVGLYLLYTVLGAVGASAVMTGKNPLELLQVKE